MRHTQTSSGPALTAIFRQGRREEVQGIMLLTASGMVLAGVTGGEGQLGRVTDALVELAGLGVLYPAVVLAFWGTRRFQHRAAYRSQAELVSWTAFLPVLLAGLEWLRRGAGGWLGFWLWAYAEVLLGTKGALLALGAAAVVLLSFCLDNSPRHLFSELTRGLDLTLLAPLRLLGRGLRSALRGMQRIVYWILRDLWVIVDLVCRRLESASGMAGPERTAPAPGVRGSPDEASAPRGEDDGTEEMEVSSGAGGEAPTAIHRPAGVVPDIEDLLSSPRMARAASLRRGESAVVGEKLSLPGVRESSVPGAETGGRGPELDEDLDPAGCGELESEDEELVDDGEDEEEEDAAAIERPMDRMPKPHLRLETLEDGIAEDGYEMPPLHLFDAPPDDLPRESDEELHRKAELITVTLQHFGIESTISRITCGPAITQFELVPAAGVKLSRLTSLADDLAMALAVARVRIEAPIPGRGAVGIEVPNKTIVPVYFQEMTAQEQFRDAGAPLTFTLGKGIAGNPVIADLGKAPHMLVAGATGAGKSVCVNTIISSLLMRNHPDDLKLLLIDPKMVEMMIYDGIAHLVAPVITDPTAASAALKWAVMEMERRYRVLSKAGYRNIQSFNRNVLAGNVEIDDFQIEGLGERLSTFPYLVVVIDELSDLMMVAAKDIEESICRLAQMARAVGIHLIVATQRPSTNVITGIIKANLPTRIAFRVASKVDSKVILDQMGAEALLGRGDMLYQPVGQPKAIRIQGAYVDEEEVKRLVSHIKTQTEPEYADIVAEVKKTLEPDMPDPADFQDEYLGACIRMAVEKGEVSTSLLQRHFKIGYNRAASIIEVMEVRGIVSGPESGRRRKVLIGPGEMERVLEEL